MPLSFVNQDITQMPVDAVVNAANSALAPGGGVCGAIFAAAGYEELDRACRAIGGCPTGQSVITPGFRLKANYVVHTVGPVWQGGGRGEAGLLRSCYETALALAADHGCRSIAFPLISAGIYGYPKGEALEIAVSAIQTFLQDHDMEVFLALFDREALALSKQYQPKATQVVAALLWRGDRFLACQRPAHKARGLLWEFLGGKVEPGESKEEALIRECREELGVTISVGEVFMELTHPYPDLTVHLTLFHAAILEGEPQKLEHNDLRWITRQEIDQYQFCPADQAILDKLRG